MSFDRFGRSEKSINFNGGFKAVAWDDTSTSGVTYLRGGYGSVCLIQQIDESAKTIKYAYGAWADRTTLEYGDDEFPR